MISVVRVCASVGGSFETASEMFWFCDANARNTASDAETSVRISLSFVASVFVRSA